MDIFTPSWWEAAGRRAGYTALAALVPLAGLLMAGSVTPVYAASVAAAAGLVSLAWSLKGLPEVDGVTVPMWRAIIARTAKTAGQVALPALTAATVVQDVGWRELGIAVGGAVATTLLRTVMTYVLVNGLPEDHPAQPGNDDAGPRHRADG